MCREKSRPEDMFGQRLYQKRARAAFPILIRQAKDRRKRITYSDLAVELDMSNPRNLNYVLGSIGITLEKLRDDPRFGEIPHIESLVVRRGARIPGEAFLKEKIERYESLTPDAKEVKIEAYWQKVYDYPHWNEIQLVCERRANGLA